MKVVALVAVGAFCWGGGQVSVSSQNAEPSKEGLEFFEKKIRPILEENCLMCHGPQGKPQGGLRLDSREGMLSGGKSGEPAVVPGDVEKSKLIKAIRFPIPKRAAYEKLRQKASNFPLVGIFVAQSDSGVRVAVTGAGNGVFRHKGLEDALAKAFTPESAAGVKIDASDLNSDLHASADYRANLISVLTQRAVAKALG